MLISAYDHRQPSIFWPDFRPHKQRTGETLFIKDYIGPFKPIWGRMEGPKGGNLILEVSATKAEIEHYMHKITNYPRLQWGTRADGFQVVATLPYMPMAELSDADQAALKQQFPNTLIEISPWHLVFELDVRQAAVFPKLFRDIYIDRHMRYGGPRWVLDARKCQQIAWDGGFGKCDRATLDRNMVDRTKPHLIAESIRELAA